MKKRRSKKFSISDMYCVECGQKNIPIPRKVGKERERGHLKKLYCVHCNKETNHCEIKSSGKYTLADFKEEFELGRFVDGNRVPLNKCLPCGNVFCKYNKDGRCWNCKTDCGRTLTDKERKTKVQWTFCDACQGPVMAFTFPNLNKKDLCLKCYKKYSKLNENDENDYNTFAIKCLEDRKNYL